MLRNIPRKVSGRKERAAEGIVEIDKAMEVAPMADNERRTVMVVDDEPMILESLTVLLGKYYSVMQARCGVEGLERLREQRVDLVLSDNRMPLMGGCEFLSRVREISPSTIRFLMTGYPDLEIMDAIKKGVIAKYLSKPWCNKDLKKVVADALDLQALKERDREGRLETRVQMARVLVQVENMKKRH